MKKTKSSPSEKIYLGLTIFGILGMIIGIMSDLNILLFYSIWTIIFAVLYYISVDRSLKRTTEKINENKVLKNIDSKNANSLPPANANAYEPMLLSNDLINNACKKFIAVDVETTGLDGYEDRIIEISAIIFENLEVTKVFSTLVDSEVPISPAASKINKITNKMLEDAPTEEFAIKQFVDFIGDAITEDTIMVAHNSKFDFKFIVAAMMRHHINANFSTLDTLSLSRKYYPGLDSYKLVDIIKFLNIESKVSHRAEQDAINCGLLFVNILKKTKVQKQTLQNMLNDEELEFAQYIKKLLTDNSISTELLRFSNRTYLCAHYGAPFIKIKFSSRKKYAIVNKAYNIPDVFETAKCSKSEGLENIRVFFNAVSDLYALNETIVKMANDTLKETEANFSNSKYYNAIMSQANELIEV